MKINCPALDEPVRLEHCRRCGHPILRAHAGGCDIRTDPTPVDRISEVAALLAGHRSYDLLPYHDGHLELAWRSSIRIRHSHQHGTVVLDHRCSVQLTNAEARRLPAPVVLTTRPSRSVVATDRPPF